MRLETSESCTDVRALRDRLQSAKKQLNAQQSPQLISQPQSRASMHNSTTFSNNNVSYNSTQSFGKINASVVVVDS